MSFMRKCIVLLLTCLLVVITSCAARDPINVDFVGSDADFDAAQRAAKEWNETCQRDLVRVFRGPGEGVQSWTQTEKNTGVLKGRAVGVTHCECGDAEYIVVQTNSGYSTMAIFAHEFGHALLTCSDDDHTEHDVMGPVTKTSETADGHLHAGAISQQQCDDALK